MRVSLRDFQLKPTVYLDKLPIELTRYGKVIAQVNVLTDNKPKPQSVNTIDPSSTKSVNTLKDKYKKLYGFDTILKGYCLICGKPEMYCNNWNKDHDFEAKTTT